MRYSKAEVQESLAALRRLCKPGTTVYTVLRHHARSGMFRRISLGVASGKEYRDISWHAAKVLGYPIRSRGGYVQDAGIGVSGCGMDMGYHLVTSLSYAIHGHKSRGEGALPENAGRPFKLRPGHYRSGYSLNHRWL
jgi:hypothetical protein